MLVRRHERREIILLRLQHLHERLPIHLARCDPAEARHVHCSLAHADRPHVAVQLQILTDRPPAAEQVEGRLKFRAVRSAAASIDIPLRSLVPEPCRTGNRALRKAPVMIVLHEQKLALRDFRSHSGRDCEIQRHHPAKVLLRQEQFPFHLALFGQVN